MPRSLADLKAKPKQLPTRTVRICLDQEALADVQRLDSERRDLLLQHEQRKNERGERPARTGEDDMPPRVAEIKTELEALYQRMRESEGDLLLRAASGGEWQRFKDQNPPREGSKTDEAITYGLCDSSALLADLGRYIVSWEGEPLGAGDWSDWFAAQVAPADLSDLCSEVCQLHEVRIHAPKAPSTDSSETPEPATA